MRTERLSVMLLTLSWTSDLANFGILKLVLSAETSLPPLKLRK